MPGKNLFRYRKYFNFHEYRAASKVCVFISHSSIDKREARQIASYLMEREIDVYFDEEDECLGEAKAKNDPVEITKCIQEGLEHSTHALVVLSPNSVESKWVAYEMGYSASQRKPIALLVLKTVQSIPEFYTLAEVIPDTTRLDAYITRLLSSAPTLLYESERRARNRYGLHPLAGIMDTSRDVSTLLR